MSFKIQNWLVVALLFVVFLLPFLSMQNFSPASDEIIHLSSGYSYIKTGETKFSPQHPPLIRMIAAVPLLFLNFEFDRERYDLISSTADEWQFSRDLFFNNGLDKAVFWGRIPMILLSVLLGWYIFKWGKELFDYKAGAVALFIYAFMPNIIGHSQLVGTDLGLAAFSFIAVYYLWKFLEDATKKNTILSGLTLGLALGSKFSAVFLLPIFVILLGIYAWKNKSGKNFMFVFGLAFLVLWALYFFPSDLLFYWGKLKTVYNDSNLEHYYYLNGNFSQDGWWYYFLWAFIIKTPIPFLVVLLWAIARYKKIGLSLWNGLFILLPSALFLFMASWKAHNIGVRYILPIYPFLILYVGGFVDRIMNNELRIMKKAASSLIHNSYFIILVLLAGWYVFSALNTYPNHLAYFNELVGGSKNGYKYLDDSNIDWGYDLKRLAEYQKENPNMKVITSWNHVDAGMSYGIKNIIPINFQDKTWSDPKGKYALSSHVVVRTKLANQIYENSLLNWRDRFKPVDRIGQSFFIYEF